MTRIGSAIPATWPQSRALSQDRNGEFAVSGLNPILLAIDCSETSRERDRLARHSHSHSTNLRNRRVESVVAVPLGLESGKSHTSGKQTQDPQPLALAILRYTLAARLFVPGGARGSSRAPSL